MAALDTNIQFLKGVGEKRARLYGKLGIATIGDLLEYYPRDYIDFSSPCPIVSAPYDEPCAIRATVAAKSADSESAKDCRFLRFWSPTGRAICSSLFLMPNIPLPR